MFVATFTGCEQKILFEDEDKIVYIPEHGYIFFNSTASNSITRGTLVTDMKRDFGVLGYKWDFENTNDIWTTVEKAAKPIVFTEDGRAEYPLHVTYGNNLYSYNNIVEWEAGKKYAFFGYYPYGNNAIVVSGKNVEGTPFIEYTLPNTSNAMLDVMTAADFNTDYTMVQNGEVVLEFKHRLSAIDLKMLNLNDPYNGKPVYVQISNMKISFTNLKYNKIKLYLDEAKANEPSVVGTVVQNYTLFQSDKRIAPATTDAAYVTSGNPLIVIPQNKDNSGGLMGTLTFNLKYVDANGNLLGWLNELAFVPVDFDTNAMVDEWSLDFGVGCKYFSQDAVIKFDRDIRPRRKNTIQLSFTRDAITIDILPDGDWVEHKSIIEFE